MTPTTTDTVSTPALVCAQCAAPMADDQRYCLDCGSRRADLPAPVAKQAPATNQASVPAPVATRTRGPLGWLTGNAAIVGGVACLLLAMGVGVMIGRAGRSPAKVAAPPQIVTVAGGAAASPTKAPAKAAKGASRKSAKAGGSSKPAASVKDLSNTTNPSDYAKKSKKLPSVVGTGGKPPPKDHKKPGGGSGFEEIG